MLKTAPQFHHNKTWPHVLGTQKVKTKNKTHYLGLSYSQQESQPIAIKSLEE